MSQDSEGDYADSNYCGDEIPQRTAGVIQELRRIKNMLDFSMMELSTDYWLFLLQFCFFNLIILTESGFYCNESRHLVELT